MIDKKENKWTRVKEWETNSTRDIDEICNDKVYDDRRQISFRTAYFCSRQTSEFLLCESCNWCASYLASKTKPITKRPNCNDNNKIKWLTISTTTNFIPRTSLPLLNFCNANSAKSSLQEKK